MSKVSFWWRTLKVVVKNGVDEMEIELEREVVQGIDLSVTEKSEGVSLVIGQKGSSKYQLKVKYK
jgi:hypothetical protein